MNSLSLAKIIFFRRYAKLFLSYFSLTFHLMPLKYNFGTKKLIATQGIRLKYAQTLYTCATQKRFFREKFARMNKKLFLCMQNFK